MYIIEMSVNADKAVTIATRAAEMSATNNFPEISKICVLFLQGVVS